MQKLQFTSHLIARCLGNNNRLELSENKILLKHSNGIEQFSWQQIDSPPIAYLGLTGGYIRFSANQKVYTVSMLSFVDTLKYQHDLFACWANRNAESLVSFVQDVEHHCRTAYLKSSSRESIQARAQKEALKWKGWHTAKGLDEATISVARRVQEISEWSDEQVFAIRQSYVTNQLTQFKPFFDEVESNPLTEKQRIACVTDNDNNLLLAGAGTGKTSVMVGRTGYLVKSGQAKAEDILLLAFGAKAAEEMDERIKERLGFDSVRASTFHSLGLKIIAEVEGHVPRLCPFELDAKMKALWMHKTLEALMHDAHYRRQLLEYFSAYYYVDKSPFQFNSYGDYLRYLNDNDIQTIKGEAVKSYGEMVIANWLYRHGLNYQYEANYRFDVSTQEYRQYQPDFYLPDYDIYIEFYGIDKDGNTLPWIDKEKYHRGIEWKRSTHEKYQTGYIELFYHQHSDGTMLPSLENQLRDRNVELSPVSQAEQLTKLEELGQVTQLAKLLGMLVDMYKASCLDQVALDTLIAQSVDPKQTAKAFGLLMPLYTKYEHYLQQEKLIDFNDMIVKALHYIQSGQFRPNWKYILVDEFQDISEPRARLVKALRDACTGCSLFCVGDDWQAIYRFTGADVKLTTEFSNYFGSTSETHLDLTFRFNSSIGDIASRFVTQNPVQIRKIIRSLNQVNQPAVSLLRQGQTELGVNPLEKALEAIAYHVELSGKLTQNKVYLLARFWHQMPRSQELLAYRQQFPSLNIEWYSFHASKGKEADYVVILGLTSGASGFPSKKVTPPLIDALLPKGDSYEFAEERRLFYVAITRARHRAYLLADMTDVSEFVVELLESKYPIETDEFETSFVQKLFEQISCHRCKTGTLQERVSEFGKFYSCSLYPRCKHKETPCDCCGQPMSCSKKQGYQVCINDACGAVRPLCQRCGSEMKLRDGQYGPFWSCTNYRKSADLNCGYTLKVTGDC
ncbi:TPA: UvrD-helicase domain-containing protein [Vibrio vulnificus]